MSEHEQLTPEEQFVYDWQSDNLDGFRDKLIEAIECADKENREKLAQVYPLEVAAFRKYKYKRGWWKALKVKTGIKW